VVLALEELHKAEIIYRDLKSGNIILDEDGHACLTDFGLSKEASVSHSFCGSSAYMAPEMLYQRGHTKVLDWYLLGLFIYECLVGRPPFWDMNKEKLFTNIKSGRYAKLDKRYSQEVKDLIEQVTAL
jgi:serine/threonine protein kinase